MTASSSAGYEVGYRKCRGIELRDRNASKPREWLRRRRPLDRIRFLLFAAGASAIGADEDIARVTFSRRVVDGIERGPDAESAATHAIEEFEEVTGSTTGVAAIDADGTVGDVRQRRDGDRDDRR